MRKLFALAAVAALTGVAAADFSGVYAPANWTFSTTGDGSGSLNATTMVVTGNDNGFFGLSAYSIVADGPVSFDWSYSSLDYGVFDLGVYRVNGVETILADNNGGAGSIALNLNAGDVLELGVFSTDGVFGAGTLTVTNFIPEPTSLSLLALGALAAFRRR